MDPQEYNSTETPLRIVLMLFSWNCGEQKCPDDFFSISQSHSQLSEDYFELLQTSKSFQNTQVMRLWSCLKKGDFCNKFWHFCPIFWPHPLENTEFGLEGPAAGAAGPYQLRNTKISNCILSNGKIGNVSSSVYWMQSLRLFVECFPVSSS